MNIQQASQITGVSKDMIRYYEKMGMLKPDRNNTNNYRIYNDHDLNLIVMIHEYSSIGMSLRAISKLINGHDIKEAALELDDSINRLKNEAIWIQAKINNAVDMAKVLNMIKNNISYEIGMRPEGYCYHIKENGFGNVYSYLAENGGIAKSVFIVKKDNIETDDWPEEHALLFTPLIKELQDELELIPCHKYYRTIIKHDKRNKLGYKDIKEIVEDIKEKGYKVSGNMYIYQIMGSIDSNVEDYVCIEFEI